MRGGWDEHYIALVIAIGYVVAADGQKTRQLALGAGVGLDGDLSVAGNLSQPAFNLLNQCAPAGGSLFRRVGVDACKFRPGNGLHGRGRVKLHRARAQRDHGAVKRQVLIGQLAQVAQHLGLRVDAVEDLVLEWLLAALQVLRQGEISLSRFGAEGLGKLGDVPLGRRFTKGYRYLIFADGAHKVSLLLEVCLDSGCVYAGDSNGVEERLGDQALSGILDGLGEGGSQPMDALRDSLEALRAVVDGVHGGHISQQRLCSTDIGGGALTADVLLAGLQRQTVSWASVRVLGYAHDAARHLALELVCDRHVGSVRSAKEERYAEALGGTEHDIGAERAGAFQKQKGKRVGGHGSQCAARMQLLDKGGGVKDIALGTGIGNDRTNKVLSNEAFAQVDDFHLEVNGAGALRSNGKHLRVQARIQHHAAALLYRARHKPHGFGGGRGLVQQGRVGNG